MQIITAPSKTQAFNGRDLADYSLPFSLKKTQRIIDRLREYSFTELGELLKTSEKLTTATLRRIEDFHQPFTPQNAKQALFIFQGDAYNSIRADRYSLDQLRHAQKQLFILSGLYGVLRPLDLMQPYRLEMGCPLAIGDAKNLYEFWRSQVTACINETFTGDEDQTLVNLASAEYARVIDRKNLQAQLVTINFKQPHKGGYRTIPIHSKRARGLMIHFIISNRLNKAETLKEFDLDGYRFSSKESSAQQWLFYQRS